MQNDLTLEKLKIDERLRKVEDYVIKQDTNMMYTMNKVDELHKHLMGNNGTGLITKIDRLEQKDQHKERHFWAIWVTLLGVIMKLIGDYFGQKPN